VENVSFFYFGSADSWRGLPMTMHFLVLVCHFSINKLTIGTLEMTDVREASSCDKSLEWATNTSTPYSSLANLRMDNIISPNFLPQP
jgi:hypothetical protein